MKKNSLFTLAYIIFVILCAIVKCFWEYPMWKTIVAAITAASWVFAMADYCFSCVNTLENETAQQTEYIEVFLEELSNIKQLIDKRLTQTDDFYEGKLYTKQEQIEHYQDFKKRVTDLESEFQKNKWILKISNNKSCIFKKIPVALNVIGFLLLFCVMTFEPIANHIINSQDAMTVWAFAIILFTQYVDDISQSKIKLFYETNQKHVNALQALRKAYEAEVLNSGI